MGFASRATSGKNPSTSVCVTSSRVSFGYQFKNTITTENGVTILGFNNWPGRIPVASSALYARNLLTFLTTFWDKDSAAPKLPEADDIVKGVMLTRGGAIVHPNFLPQQAA